MSDKRAKFYQLTNNVTDDVYIGSTSQVLYKRLYIHKTDMTKGSPSRLCALMQKLGKDKFKIELLEEGVFADTDAVNARELFWMREKGSTLNEGYTKATTEVKEELKEYMLHIQELQHKVQMLEFRCTKCQYFYHKVGFESFLVINILMFHNKFCVYCLECDMPNQNL